MAFINDADIQAHLPKDKLDVDNLPDDVEAFKLDAERIIRGYLASVFEPLTLAAWITPEVTPGQIRAVGGRLAAAFIYRVRYSEDDTDTPEYAQTLYNEAMAMLVGIANGSISLDDVLDVGATFDNSHFYPNATAADPIFSMESRF